MACYAACLHNAKLHLVREPLLIAGAASSIFLIRGGEGSDRRSISLSSQGPGIIVYAASRKNPDAPPPTDQSATTATASTVTSLRRRFGTTDRSSKSTASGNPAPTRDKLWTTEPTVSTEPAAASCSPLRVTGRPVSAGAAVSATGDVFLHGKSTSQQPLSLPPRNHTASNDQRPCQAEESVIQGGLSPPRLSSSARVKRYFTPKVSFCCRI